MFGLGSLVTASLVQFSFVKFGFDMAVLVRSVAFSSVVLCFVPLRWVKFCSGSLGELGLDAV